ncbi:transcription elongation factor spt5 [Yamadazyma tenuis]|uniref:transcription elongation factor spt5 n=1 Tax=Candida tenuis TaxID=2315449 RepID=UPI00279B3F46|nr:transcription elongation factor spt5 [Yamadazyma tenuis]
MSEETTDKPVDTKHDINEVSDAGYDVSATDQGEIDEQKAEASAESESIKAEYQTGDKRRLEEDNEGDVGSNVRVDDDDDDDEEDEDDDDVGGNKRRKARRANQFLDIEAEVDDEEEDELDEDDEEAELLREQFISDDHDRERGEVEESHDDRLHRQFDRRRQEAEDQDAEKLAETLKQRYRRTHGVYRGDTTTSGTVSQKLLMPSINDPAIYAIRCSPGREKELVRKLFEKKRTLSRSAKPLDILTVFQRDSFKGYIYIEAKKPEAIERALTGMVNVYARQKLLVPVREYPDLLKQVKSSDVELVPGIYVRITRGKYKGDLAIVDNLSENGLDVRCKLVPRLDYGKNDEFDKEGKRIKSKIVPIPRLFSESEARLYDNESLQPGRGPRSFIYKGEEYTDGFLFKDFKLQFVQTQNVHPSLEELDRFQTGDADEDGLDIAAVAASLKNKKNGAGQSSTFQPGDKVEIRRGEQAKTIGKVVSSSLNEVSITITDSEDKNFINQKLTVPGSDLRKVFLPGDHVKVIEGKHSEETGLVIKVENDSVVLLSDQTQEDIKVFANYLIKATDTSSTVASSDSKYEIKDLVELSASTVGVILKTEKDLFQVLTSDGRFINVKPSGIASKLKLSRLEQVATDRKGITIKVGDTVKELTNDKKREGNILHIYKNTLFIKSNEIIENLGIFVANSMNVMTVSSKDSMVSKSLGPDLTKMNPNFKAPNPLATAGLKTRVGGRDKLIYKDVVVTGGNHKGLMGKVTDADDIYARIELHTNSKKIKVKKNQLSVLIRGQSIPYLRFIGAPDTQGQDMNAPRTSGPAFSSETRSGGWSSRGPAGSGGASTWEGGKTPAGGASAWGSGSTSSWGTGANANGGSSSWGGASSWKKGGNSSWGGANEGTGANSSWGNNGANSSWGNNGANSSWGNNSAPSTWGTNGGNSSWGSNK